MRPASLALALLVVSCAGGGEPAHDGADERDAVSEADAAVDARGDLPPDRAADSAADVPLDRSSPDRGDASDAGAAACPPSPNPDEGWITAYQSDLLAHLAGDAEVAPGVTLGDRATVENRARTREYLSGALRALGLAPQVQTYGS